MIPSHVIGRAFKAAILATLFGASPLHAQRYTIEYTVTMPDPASHLYSVQIFIGGLLGQPVELQMPVWSPGRYARMGWTAGRADKR